MTKTKSQRARAKQARKGNSAPPKQSRGANKQQPRKQNKKSKQRSRGAKFGLGSKRTAGVGGNFMSLVSDGVNVGSVWKNTTAERVTFPMAREKFADLTSTGTTFQTLVQQYLNPGNTQLFPIFSNIAKNYEEYIPNHLKVYFRTEEYMASGSTVSAGLAALGVNFDPDAANFATMTELENYEHSISGAPFSGIMCLDVLEHHKKRFKGKSRDLSLNNYFVNYSPNQIAPGSTPAKFYDIGNLQCDVNGTQAGIIGELWIEYSFTLIRRLQTPGAPVGGVAHWSSIAATTANNFAGAVLQTGNTLSGITLGTNTIVMPANAPGNYLIVLTAAGATSATAFGSPVDVGTLALFTQSAVRDAVANVQSLAGTTSSPAVQLISTSTPNAGETITISASTIVGTGSMDLFIISLPSTVLTLEQKEEIEHEKLKQIVEKQSNRMEHLERMIHKLVGHISNSGGSLQNVVELGSSESDEEAATSDLVKLPLKKTLRSGKSKGPVFPEQAGRIDVDECKEQSSASSKSWFGSK